jgi:hypothetical protein
MAHQLYQLANVQETFATRIQQKIQNHRDQAGDRAEAVPLLGWLLAPLPGIAFDVKEGRNVRRGERGEEAVLNALLRKLPDSWFIFHSVVVEPQLDDFAPIDLLLIGHLAGQCLCVAKPYLEALYAGASIKVSVCIDYFEQRCYHICLYFRTQMDRFAVLPQHGVQ